MWEHFLLDYITGVSHTRLQKYKMHTHTRFYSSQADIENPLFDLQILRNHEAGGDSGLSAINWLCPLQSDRVMSNSAA